MELKDGLESFLASILEEFEYHPFVAPYLSTSKENPPQQYIHQCEVVGRLALRVPIRVLIGDEIGLGKTLTALSLAKYLEKLERAKKCLIIVPRVLVWQWHKELLRMGIPDSKIKHIERDTLEFLKLQNFPDGYYIASMDLLKMNERIVEIESVPWDLIIVDEAHKFGHKTKRFGRVGKRLIEAETKRDVLFLSATPHRGDPQDYIARLQLLDPFLIDGWKSLDRSQFYDATHGALLFRRTKEDVNKIYEGREVFPPAKFYACVINAREDEAEFVNRLVNFLRTKLIEFAYERGAIDPKIIPLLTVLVFKRASSSPFAAMTTLERLLVKRVEPEFSEELIDSVRSFLEVGYEDYEYEKDPDEIFNEFLDRASPLLSERDRKEISDLRDKAKAIMEKGDSKINALISLLEDIMVEGNSKAIIFTEYKDTLKYLVQNLELKHPEWSKNIVQLSSDETRDEHKFQKIRNRFEKDPEARILIATDVVAEGVNLQVANILVNYEIPWSLIKVEQRIGRVWRLGQKKEVEAYTLFMNNNADIAALKAFYEKLTNLKRAKLQPRAITGQDILLYSDAEELTKFPSVPTVVVEDKKKKKFLKVTEYKTILTFLKEGKSGLENLVSSIIKAKQEVESELASKGVLYKPKTRQEVEKTMQLLGFSSPSEVLESFKKIVRSSSRILNFNVIEKEDFKVIVGQEMPKRINTIDEVYGLFFNEKRLKKPITLVSYGNVTDKLFLIPVRIREKSSGKVVYRELVGVWKETGTVLRGSKLLETISNAVSNCMGIPEESVEEVNISLLANITSTIRDSALKLLEPHFRYLSLLENLRMREYEKTWIRANNLEVLPQNAIGCITFIKIPQVPEIQLTEEEKDAIEKKAVEIVKQKEKEENRIPQEVPVEEHYDIKSVDPLTGEIRLIEVKGHKGPEVYGELTASEAKLAEVEGERYWLYIVFDIGSKDPKLLRFRDPLKTMNWRIFEKVEKRFILWPKD
ncbi:MAG: helicase-related protein [Thermoproteota archaeon]